MVRLRGVRRRSVVAAGVAAAVTTSMTGEGGQTGSYDARGCKGCQGFCHQAGILRDHRTPLFIESLIFVVPFVLALLDQAENGSICYRVRPKNIILRNLFFIKHYLAVSYEFYGGREN
jgi:hypothetical protein